MFVEHSEALNLIPASGDIDQAVHSEQPEINEKARKKGDPWENLSKIPTINHTQSSFDEIAHQNTSWCSTPAVRG